MLTTLDDKTQGKVAKETNLPPQLAAARVGANRWFVVSLLLAIGLTSSIWIMYSMFGKIEQRTELRIIKLSRDGSWEVDENTFKSPPQFFTSTVDHLLTRYVRARYGQIPETITRDYGEAQVFMSPTISGQFVSTDKGGFNAAQKAADIAAKPAQADRLDIDMTMPPDHYDHLAGKFVEGSRQVVRTNLYFTRTTRTVDGHLKGVPEKMILRVQWTLIPKTELQAKRREWIDLNPIGLQIIAEELIEDPNVAEPNAQEKTP